MKECPICKAVLNDYDIFCCECGENLALLKEKAQSSEIKKLNEEIFRLKNKIFFNERFSNQVQTLSMDLERTKKELFAAKSAMTKLQNLKISKFGRIIAVTAITISIVIFLKNFTTNETIAHLNERLNEMGPLPEQLAALRKENESLKIQIGKLEEKNKAQLSQFNTIQGENKSLQNKFNELQEQYDASKKIWFFNIESIKVGNSNSGWLNQPGERLTASNIRYLSPSISISSKTGGTMTFYIKLFTPSGVLFRNENVSPIGYTYSDTVNLNQGYNENVFFSGWGNAERSSYSQGKWRVEIWYEGICAGMTTVTLN
ncbi:MAG: hypothetical protein LBO04_08485 [Spirochaetaceae bacterium]|jgi:uncharacterized Zn finger protein (UPF0148 family)|nr:hypothetical protein [Spirochaetaceae bacterium]